MRSTLLYLRNSGLQNSTASMLREIRYMFSQAESRRVSTVLEFTKVVDFDRNPGSSPWLAQNLSSRCHFAPFEYSVLLHVGLITVSVRFGTDPQSRIWAQYASNGHQVLLRTHMHHYLGGLRARLATITLVSRDSSGFPRRKSVQNCTKSVG